MGRTIITEADVKTEREQLHAFRIFLHALFKAKGGTVRIPTNLIESATGDFSLLWYEEDGYTVYVYKDRTDPAPKWNTGESRDGFIDPQS